VAGCALSIRGHVVTGDGRGRRIGFPTANVQIDDSGSPVADLELGVYAATVRVGEGERYRAVANWGCRPTFGADGRTILELHIIDFCEDIYGCLLQIELVEFLRPEQAFSSVDSLKEQIALDIGRVEQIMKNTSEE
jgi:riboflavin kinase/FMN adenylyltransferase